MLLGKWLFKILPSRLTDLENKLMIAGGRLQEGIVRKPAMDIYTAIFKVADQQGPTVERRDSAQCHVAAWRGAEGVRENGYTDMCG